ncbi:bifunctional riboflavin kinase/FAD synthetase [Selenomonas noxia]|jgi:riboflavin biosynthesis protein ribF|uniref:bifunctional riboflavin kinase/FAD synthetase n=1 Tax=Selenomonas noxia TaxID=135083 RepID=UPI00248C9948|nr:bifunctional riboflavin kinase/FAD synthetase [Selenomonas noxia]
MEKYTQLAYFSSKYENIVIALGMFDGLHIGHQEVIRTAVKKAQEIKGTALVFSFANHPRAVIVPEGAPHRIGCQSVRLRILKNLGVDALVEIAFTSSFAETTANGFIHLLQQYFAPKYIVVGENYTFGRGGRGNPNLLKEQSGRYGFHLIVCPPVLYGGVPVSSTRIRALLAQGDLSHVNAYLGYPFTVTGTVIHGQERGRTLGFPTANVSLHESYESLPNGVYAVMVVHKKHSYHGVANIGNNPTFGGYDRRLEVHIIDFSGDLYDSEITVSFFFKIRDEQRFSTADELIFQIKKDKEAAIKGLKESFRLQENISMVI